MNTSFVLVLKSEKCIDVSKTDNSLFFKTSQQNCEFESKSIRSPAYNIAKEGLPFTKKTPIHEKEPVEC